MPHKDPEARKAYLAAYYLAHQETIKERSREWHCANPEKTKAASKRQIAKTTDRRRAWKIENADLIAAQKNEAQLFQKERRRNNKREYQRRYRAKRKAMGLVTKRPPRDLDKSREYGQKWRNQQDPEALRARRRKAYLANRNKEIEAAIEWQRHNPDRVKELARQWQKANPERVNRYALVRRSLCRNSTDIEQITAWQNSWRSAECVTCEWCFKTLPGKNAHADHIVALHLGGEHRLDNLCIACPKCNLRKGAKDVNDWLSVLHGGHTVIFCSYDRSIFEHLHDPSFYKRRSELRHYPSNVIFAQNVF